VPGHLVRKPRCARRPSDRAPHPTRARSRVRCPGVVHVSRAQSPLVRGRRAALRHRHSWLRCPGHHRAWQRIPANMLPPMIVAHLPDILADLGKCAAAGASGDWLRSRPRSTGKS
jgi:hypothetical protein